MGLYDENLKLVSDWKFFILALFKFNCTYHKINAVLSTYYMDGMSSALENRDLLNQEREQVLDLDFKGYIEDTNELLKLRKTISNLRNSKKIGWLVKLGLLHKF